MMAQMAFLGIGRMVSVFPQQHLSNRKVAWTRIRRNARCLLSIQVPHESDSRKLQSSGILALQT